MLGCRRKDSDGVVTASLKKGLRCTGGIRYSSVINSLQSDNFLVIGIGQKFQLLTSCHQF